MARIQGVEQVNPDALAPNSDVARKRSPTLVHNRAVELDIP